MSNIKTNFATEHFWPEHQKEWNTNFNEPPSVFSGFLCLLTFLQKIADHLCDEQYLIVTIGRLYLCLLEIPDTIFTTTHGLSVPSK